MELEHALMASGGVAGACALFNTVQGFPMWWTLFLGALAVINILYGVGIAVWRRM